MATESPVLSAHTFGSILRGREMRGLAVEEVVMPPGLRVPEHGHEGAQIYFLLEGRYAESAAGTHHELGPGAAWFRPPRAPHANEVVGAQPALTLIVTIEEECFRSVERRAAGPRALRSRLLDETRDEMLREIRGGDPGAAAALEGWALLLLARTQRLLAGAEIGVPEWLRDAQANIREHFLEPLSLATVAAHVGVHPATLAAGFRRYHGASVGETIRELRLHHAKVALQQTRRPLAEIALEAGFFDQAHLGRCFLRRFGVTPAACRAGRDH